MVVTGKVYYCWEYLLLYMQQGNIARYYHWNAADTDSQLKAVGHIYSVVEILELSISV